MSQLSLSQIVWWTVWVSAVGGISLVCSSHWLSCQTAFISSCERVWSVKCEVWPSQTGTFLCWCRTDTCSLLPPSCANSPLVTQHGGAGPGRAGRLTSAGRAVRGDFICILYYILWIDSFFLAKKKSLLQFLIEISGKPFVKTKQVKLKKNS